MSAAKKTISLPKKLLQKAEGRAEELDFSTFSDYIQDLIRRDIVVREQRGSMSQPELDVPGVKKQKADKN
jgi:metal-responsive CopG/Arc/MetJ family transcriptional regulator